MTSKNKVIEVLKQFPFFFDIIPVEITDDFDGATFDRWAMSAGLSTSEIIICQFVLMIWNHREKWKTGPFLISDAANQLDDESFKIIQEWVNKPFFL